MASSEIVVPGAGPGDTVAVPPYEDKSHIRVAKGIVDQDESLYEWSGPQEITLGPGFPAASAEHVRVYRTTPDDEMVAILDPEDGLDYQGANANWRRLLFIVQELKDIGGVANLEELEDLLQAAIASVDAVRENAVEQTTTIKDDAVVAKNAALAAQAEAETARDGSSSQRALAQIAAGTAQSWAGSATTSAMEAEEFAYTASLSAMAAYESAEDAENTLLKAVQVDGPQSFTTGEKNQGRENLLAVGNLHKVSVLEISLPEFVLDPSTSMFEVELYGAGGGGGGSAGGTAAGTVIAGSGGGGGGWCYKLFSKSPSAPSLSVSLGAAGAGNSGAAGGAGGSSTVTYNGLNLTAGGGAGGATHTVSSGGGVTNGGLGGAASGGDINIKGGDGMNGFGFGTADMGVAVAFPGAGGSGANGGNSRSTMGRTASASQQAGRAGDVGGGGSGSYSMNAGTAQAGGAGGTPRCIIREYR